MNGNSWKKNHVFCDGIWYYDDDLIILFFSRLIIHAIETHGILNKQNKQAVIPEQLQNQIKPS